MSLPYLTLTEWINIFNGLTSSTDNTVHIIINYSRALLSLEREKWWTVKYLLQRPACRPMVATAIDLFIS